MLHANARATGSVFQRMKIVAKKTRRKRPTENQPNRFNDEELSPAKSSARVMPKTKKQKKAKRKRGRPVGSTGPIERTQVRQLYNDFRGAIALRYGFDPNDPNATSLAIAKWMAEDPKNADAFIRDAFLPLVSKMVRPGVSETELVAKRIEAEAIKAAAQQDQQGGQSQGVNIIMSPNTPPLPGAPVDSMLDVVPEDIQQVLPAPDEDEWEDGLDEFEESS